MNNLRPGWCRARERSIRPGGLGCGGVNGVQDIVWHCSEEEQNLLHPSSVWERVVAGGLLCAVGYLGGSVCLILVQPHPGSPRNRSLDSLLLKP